MRVTFSKITVAAKVFKFVGNNFSQVQGIGEGFWSKPDSIC